MRAALAITLALLVTACAPAPGADLQRKAPASYAFAFSSYSGLLALDAAGTPLGIITELPQASGIPTGLALARDGTRLVFSLTLAPHPTRGFGTDVYSLALEGTDLRPVLEHEAENVFYGAPTLTKDQVLYVHRRAARTVNGQPAGNTDEIVQVDLRTGTRRLVMDNASDPALSPDGTYLVYVHMTSGAPAGLWRVNADGSGARPFLQSADTFWYLQTPRFSPDGSTIAFSAAGRTAGRAPGSAGGRQAHLGVPSYLYLVDATGRNLREVTRTDDDVWPAWSPDGAKIAYVSGLALHVLDVASGAVTDLASGENYGYGELVWMPR